MYSKLFGFFFIILLSASTITANEIIQISGSQKSVAAVQTFQDNGTLSDPSFCNYCSSYSIGSYNVPYPSRLFTSRTSYGFDLSSIPSDMIIVNVRLQYNLSSNEGNFKFNITTCDNISSPADAWANIGSSSQIFSDINYFPTLNYLSNSTLSTLVANNRNGTIYLGGYSENEGPGYSSGNNLDLTLYVEVQRTSVSFTIDNNFGAANGTDGNITVNGITYSAPHTFSGVPVGTNFTLQAVSPQTDNQGYQRVWNTSGVSGSISAWQQIVNGSRFTRTNNSQYSFTVSSADYGTTYIANLMKIYNPTFQNNFAGNGSGGSIIVNGSSYSSPASGFSVVEQNSIYASAMDQTYNGTAYCFTSWSNGSNSNSYTFYPTSNTTYTANFVQHVSASISGPDYIKVGTNGTWTASAANGFSGYSYQWYDMYPSNNNLRALVIRPNLPTRDVWYPIGSNSATLVTTFPLFNGVLLKCVVTDSHNYNVTSNIMSIESGLSKESTEQSSLAVEAPKEYLIAQNYPNPFNPTTTIKYQLPKAGFVTLKVYDALGKEVKSLVNGNEDVGYYEVNFDASNLASGMYFYQIKSNGFISTKKMILTK